MDADLPDHLSDEEYNVLASYDDAPLNLSPTPDKDSPDGDNDLMISPHTIEH